MTSSLSVPCNKRPKETKQYHGTASRILLDKSYVGILIPGERLIITSAELRFNVEASAYLRKTIPIHQVPSRAERLLLLLMPRKDGAIAVGDLEETFPEIVAKHGIRFARWWYRAQAALVLMNSLLSLVERLAKLFKRSG